MFVLIALIVPGCVHVYLHFAVGVGSSGVCMFHVLIVMFILVLNCEMLWANLVGLGTYRNVMYYYYYYYTRKQ